jgi:hypothetical protein
MIHEIADSLKVLLDKIDAVSPQAPDSLMMSLPSPPSDDSFATRVAATSTLDEDYAPAQLVVVSELPEEEGALPDWADSASVNARNVTMTSPSHYIALCGLGKGVCNVLLDTAGAKTMIDL